MAESGVVTPDQKSVSKLLVRRSKPLGRMERTIEEGDHDGEAKVDFRDMPTIDIPTGYCPLLPENQGSIHPTHRNT